MIRRRSITDHKYVWISAFLAMLTMVFHLSALGLDQWKVLVRIRPLNLSLVDDVVNREGLMTVYRKIHLSNQYTFGLFRRCVHSFVGKEEQMCSHSTALQFVYTENTELSNERYHQCLVSDLYLECNSGRIQRPSAAHSQWPSQCRCGFLPYAVKVHRLSIVTVGFLAIPVVLQLLFLMLTLIHNRQCIVRRRPATLEAGDAVAQQMKELRKKVVHTPGNPAIHGGPLPPRIIISNNSNDVEQQQPGTELSLQSKLISSCERLVVRFRPAMLVASLVSCLLIASIIILQLSNRKTELVHFLSLLIHARKIRNYPSVDLTMLEMAKQNLLDSIQPTFKPSFGLQCAALISNLLLTGCFFFTDMVSSDVDEDDDGDDDVEDGLSTVTEGVEYADYTYTWHDKRLRQGTIHPRKQSHHQNHMSLERQRRNTVESDDEYDGDPPVEDRMERLSRPEIGFKQKSRIRRPSLAEHYANPRETLQVIDEHCSVSSEVDIFTMKSAPAGDDGCLISQHQPINQRAPDRVRSENSDRKSVHHHGNYIDNNAGHVTSV